MNEIFIILAKRNFFREHESFFPFKTKRRVCEMTTEDMNLAKVELQRLDASTPDQIGFKRDNQYVIGDINLINYKL